MATGSTVQEEEEKLLNEPIISQFDLLSKNGYPVTNKRFDPIARILLLAVYDDNHPFSIFRGMRYLMKHIWEFVKQFNKHYWYKYIVIPNDSVIDHIDGKCFAEICAATFPKRNLKGININMMPFIMSDSFEKSKLPSNLEGYYEGLIRYCLNKDRSQLNKICYLTIQESFVDKDKTQRRPGLHVETPGIIKIKQDKDERQKYVKGDGECIMEQEYLGWWGMGDYIDKPHDGIYMASNVDDSCAVWNCKINSNEDGREVIGYLGDIEHLRDNLLSTQKMIMMRNKIYWICDRTPHETLPMKESGYRQFFRLVTSNVNLWYQHHSTPNPNGVKPGKGAKIIRGSKFEVTSQFRDSFQVNEESNKCSDCILL